LKDDIQAGKHLETLISLDLEGRLKFVDEQLANASSPQRIDSLFGTIGADPIQSTNSEIGRLANFGAAIS